MAQALVVRDGHCMSMASFRYRVHGLRLLADAPIPVLRPVDHADADADVHVRMRGSLGSARARDTDAVWYESPHRDDRGAPFVVIHLIDSGYLFTYAEGARFLVDVDATRVDAWWDGPLTDADAADYLLSGVLAFVLRVRGVVPLHASAVVIADRALLFAGAAGAGKSSTAAAFATLGIPVLSDDMVALTEAGERLVALPSYPRLSLWPDSANGLFATESLPTHSAVYSKHCLDLDVDRYRFHDSPAPIEAIFFLAPREAARQPTVRPLTRRTALMNLVSHTYGNYLLDPAMRGREFEVLGRIADRITVSELSFGSSLGELVAGCRRLADELALQSLHE
jgi:hypothetical protein